ncbi:methylated-DNA--[protein]-cysteine S-methyltransferase [Odoribacter laneus]|uniref:methylated-DNA--[protein]-cysteine S-methyltransferase n=1 Tax=Odoribacter laneus TaxID=626933 RepID=UPI0039968BD4
MWVGDRIAFVPQQPERIETPLLREAKAQLEAYFERRLQKFSLPLFLQGTAFQLKVWKLLQDIPYGEITTYGEIAALSGNPKACRAVGRTNGQNPLPIFIPCHRVVGSGKKLVGYTGGLDIKIKLLEIEGVL